MLIRLSSNPRTLYRIPASHGICTASLVLSTLQHHAGTACKKKVNQSYHCMDDDGGAYGTDTREITLQKRKGWLSRACEMSQHNTKGVELQ